MKRAVTWIGVGVGVLLFLWIAMHLMLTTINPAQESPADHFQSACWACHMTLESAELTE
jgi:heterodisulfide reductase subunit B